MGSIRVAFFKRDETFPTGWESLFCEVLDEDLALSSGSNYFTSFATEMVSGQGLTYTLTAEASCGLYNLITSEGAGEYQLRVSSQTCGGNWQQAFASRLTVNPSTGFAVRFHHRDHLGSSAVSRAYSPGFDEAVAGAAPFYLKTASGNMTLYAKPAKATLFDPFGEVLGSVAGEPNPRYTDHEYDEASGLNYMKGRFSLAAYGGKFNRPDPMRDWDWENPFSINLYEYVRNNPVMANDPTGFFGDGPIKKSHQLVPGAWQKILSYLGIKSDAKKWANSALRTSNEDPDYVRETKEGIAEKFETDVIQMMDKIGAYSQLSYDGLKTFIFFGILLPAGTEGVTGKVVQETVETAAKRGIWNSIKATQSSYPGSIIPRSFELSTSEGARVWVHGNATKHLAEFAAMKASSNTPGAVRLASQVQLSSLQAAVNEATKNGIIYGKLIEVGGWELKFVAPRNPGDLPALIHALAK